MRIPATSDFRDTDGLSDFALNNLDYFAAESMAGDPEPEDDEDLSLEELMALDEARARQARAAYERGEF